ncbi:MAG: RIP metalloprotease RseP [Xanthomonadaceae bacterium]|jgi:regulator of sigma E protease|nr:RIP metalloprotease RseP [Xanthomonadaceae bacterium]
MSEFFGSIWWLIVSLSLLVTFHEFGHYWVARRCGVRVLRFSVGFGRPLLTRRNRAGTEFVIAAIPLGGYVKMLDEREGPVHPADLPYAFNRKNIWQRIAIVAAGPGANLLLCVCLLWAMFVIGRQDYAPVIGHVAGIAAEDGFKPGERILQVGDRNVATWGDAIMAMAPAALDRQDIQIQTRNQYGQQFVRTLSLSQLPQGFAETQIDREAGFTWQFMVSPPLIDSVQPNSAADGVLQPGDLILAIDGQRVSSADQVAPLVQILGESGEAALIDIERDGKRLALDIRPRHSEQPRSGEAAWALGIVLGTGQRPGYDAVQRYGPLAAIPAAFRETGKLTSDTLGMIRRMITGQASIKNISGPVTIARVANASVKRGPDWFIYFLALVSLSLAIINLMPIPILDGGHLLYYLIELVKGSPLSERATIAGQYIGLALLAGLMGLAFYNDILNLIPR